MDVETKLAALIELAESCDITVRMVPTSGDSREHPGGALVRLKDKEILFLDPIAPPAEQIDVLATALRSRSNLQDRFLPPEIRREIDGKDWKEIRDV